MFDSSLLRNPTQPIHMSCSACFQQTSIRIQTNQRLLSIFSSIGLSSSRETCDDTPAASSTELCQLVRLPVCLQEGLFHGDSTPVDSGWSIHSSRWQAGYNVDRSRSVGGVRHGRPFHPHWAPAVREFGVTWMPLAWLRSYLIGRKQFVKMGQHQSPAVGSTCRRSSGSVLGLLLFAAYCSPVQLHLAMPCWQHSCWTDCRPTVCVYCWRQSGSGNSRTVFSSTLVIGTVYTGDRIRQGHRFRCWSQVASSWRDESTGRHATCRSPSDIRQIAYLLAVARSCNYRVRVICHICHLISTEVVQTLACSDVDLILSSIDYCNVLLHST